MRPYPHGGLVVWVFFYYDFIERHGIAIFETHSIRLRLWGCLHNLSGQIIAFIISRRKAAARRLFFCVYDR